MTKRAKFLSFQRVRAGYHCGKCVDFVRLGHEWICPICQQSVELPERGDFHSGGNGDNGWKNQASTR